MSITVLQYIYINDFSTVRSISIIITSICAVLSTGAVISIISCIVPLLIKEEKTEESDSSNCTACTDEEKKKEVSLVRAKKKKLYKRIVIGLVVVGITTFVFVFINTSEILKVQSINEDDSKYIGQMINNKPEGVGAKYDAYNRIKYAGEFHNGKFEGEGQLFFYNTDYSGQSEYEYYKGRFLNGYLNGHAEHHRVNGKKDEVVYTGVYSKDKRNGIGKESVYDEKGELQEETTGFWLNDSPNGYGRIVIYEGEKIVERYTGNIVNGQYKGLGALEYVEDGDVICVCGMFENNMANGECISYNRLGIEIEQGYFLNGECVFRHSIEHPMSYPRDLRIDGLSSLFEDDFELNRINDKEFDWLESNNTSWLKIFDYFEKYDSVKHFFWFIIVLLSAVFLTPLMCIVYKYKKSKSNSERGHLLLKILEFSILMTVILIVIIVFWGNMIQSLNGNKFVGFLDEDQNGVGAEYNDDGQIVRCGQYVGGKLYSAGREYKYNLSYDNSVYIESKREGTYIDGVLNGRVEEYHYDYKGNVIEEYKGSVTKGIQSGYGIYLK